MTPNLKVMKGALLFLGRGNEISRVWQWSTKRGLVESQGWGGEILKEVSGIPSVGLFKISQGWGSGIPRDGNAIPRVGGGRIHRMK